MIFAAAKRQGAEAMLKRFDVDRHGRLLFRSRPTAVPVVVTEAERDAAVAGFGCAVGRLGWGLVLGLLAAIVLLVALDRPDGERSVETWFIFLIALVGFALLYWRAWHEPTRRFAGRAIAGSAASRSEARRQALRQLRWRELWVGAASVIAIVGSQAAKQDVLNGWGRLWLVAGAAALVLIGWRMVAKFRSDRAG